MALECLIHCDRRHLKPYEEHLANLLDERKLRAELVSFGIDEQTAVVTSEHRPHVIPVLMR